MKKIKKTDLVSILAVALVFAVITTMNSRLLIRSMKNQTEKVGQTQISSIKTDFENYIANAENALIKVASGAALYMGPDGDKVSLEKFIISQKKEQLDTSNGVNFNVYIAGPGWEIIPDFDAPADYHGTERNWYIGAVESSGEIYITDPYIDSMTGDMCFTMSLLLSDGETVVAMDFTLSEIQQSIQRMSESSGSVAMILTADGLIVGYSDMSFVGGELQKKLPEYEPVFDEILERGGEKSFESKIGGESHTIFHSVTKNNWYMIVCVNNNKLYGSVTRQVIVNILINVAMLVLIVILYVFSVKNRVRKEQALASRELFVDSLLEKMKEPVQTILGVSRETENLGLEKGELAEIKAAGLRMNEIMRDLSSYSSIVSNLEKNAEEKKKKRREVSGSIRRFRNIIVILLLAVMVISSYFYYDSENSFVRVSMYIDRNRYAHQLEKWEQEQMTILSMFTNWIAAEPERMDDYEDAVAWMDSIARSYSSISVCYLANPYREHTVIMNNGWQPDADWKVEEREWYKETEKSADGTNISAPYYDEQTGAYCITISKIVYGKNGEFLGIFGIDLYMDKIIKIFGEGYTRDEYVFLVDANGDIINHPNPEYQMSDTVKMNIQDTPYKKIYNSEVESPSTVKDYDGDKKVCMVMHNEELRFDIVLVYDWDAVYLFPIFYTTVYIIFILAIVILIVVLINKVIRSQADMNRKLTEAVRDAEAAGNAKSEFLAQMSHEIRTPINAVIGMDEMILRETKEPVIREYASDIRSASKTLLTLINGILDFSKIESGKMEIVPAQYELKALIDNSVNMISERAEKKGLSLQLIISEQLPRVLYGDDVRIRQVLTNLLTNAVKYTEKGTVTLTMRGETYDEDEFVLFVDVSDTGIGIKEEDMEKLFQSFRRLEESRNRTIEGTGLGMSIVDGILKLMDSSLDVKSEYGKGSSFSFRIKQGIIDSTPLGEYRRHQLPAETENTHKRLKIHGAKILVVDDNGMNLKVASSLMKRMGAEPDLAESGPVALNMVRDQKYDIILMDHMMPGMDGIETLERLNRYSMIDESTAVIALTANAVAGAKEMYLAKGFRDYLSKPISPEELEKMMAEYLPEGSFAFVDEEAAEEKPQESVAEEKPQKNAPEEKPQEIVAEEKPAAGTEKAEEKPAAGTEEAEEKPAAGAEKAEEEDTADSASAEDAGAVETLRRNGFNVEAALKYSMNDEEILVTLLDAYVQDADEKKSLIAELYEKRDWPMYKIQVHALKSSSRTIGADALADMALEQELASGESDEGKIDSGFAPMMEAYDKVLDILRNL